MKVTIIEKQYFEGKTLRQSTERVFFPKDMDELSRVPLGYIAKRIRMECEFEEKDIPKLIEFLQYSQSCLRSGID